MRKGRRAFDMNLIELGAEVETRDGRIAKFVNNLNADKTWPAYPYPYEFEIEGKIYTFNKQGSFSKWKVSPYDLFIITRINNTRAWLWRIVFGVTLLLTFLLIILIIHWF